MILGSINVPFSEVLTNDGLLKPLEDVRSVFTEAGVDFSKKLVMTCGSGLTACILALALWQLDKEEVSMSVVYQYT